MKYAIIDTMALTYSAKYAMPKLYSGDQRTGILFGFTKYLLALQKEFHFDQFIFCFDSKNSKRKEIYPEYKAQRNNFDETRTLVYSQFDIIKNEILPKIGFKNLFETDGLEADDIIGSLCRSKNTNTNLEELNKTIQDEYIIISRDQDLYQLLNINISQYDYISKKMITLETFQEKYGIDPIQWGMVKAISGCKSDSVPGIERIGEKTACKYLNDTINFASKAYGKIEMNQDIVERNKELVILPFKGTPEYRIVKDKISFESLQEVFIKYNFQSQLTNTSLDQWRKNFNWIDIKKNPTIFDF